MPTPATYSITLAQDLFARSNQTGWGTGEDGQPWGTNSGWTMAINNNAGTVTGNLYSSSLLYGYATPNISYDLLCTGT